MPPRARTALLIMAVAASAGRADDALSALRRQGGDVSNAGPQAQPQAVTLPGGAGDSADCGLHPYVLAAVQKVRSCLAPLNAEMTGKIAEGIKNDRFTFVCGGGNGTEGGHTDQQVDAQGRLVSATITIQTKAEPSASGMAIALPDRQASVFHELIHAVDDPQPRPRYILGATEHMKRGYADAVDAVYGCFFACYSKELSDGDIRAVDRFEKAYGDIPEEGSCESDKSGDANTPCSALQKYRYLCRTGRPYMDGANLRAVRLKQLPTCVMEKIINECRDAACVALRKKVEDDAERTDAMAKAIGQPVTGQMSGEMRDALRQQGQRLAGAWQSGDASGLSEEDAGLYRAASKGRRSLFNACLR